MTRTVPPSTNFPGLTEISFPDGRTLSCVGVGKAVEKAIRKQWEKTR